MTSEARKKDNSIAGQSAAHFVTKDDSFASLLLNHGIKIRDFILLSFLSDQGPMSVGSLSRVVGLDEERTLRSLNRLSDADLVVHEPSPTEGKYESTVKLTKRGADIAGRISAQIE